MAKVLVIEGNIGAGKSTLIEILKSELKSDFNSIVSVPEPVELWKSSGALENFYLDIHANAYQFQTYTFCTRIQALKQSYETNSNADLYIIERSPFSDRYIFVDMLAKAGHLSSLQMTMYETWWQTWLTLWPIRPTHFLHLNPGVDQCMKRTLNRARNGESSVTLEYQQALDNQHRLFFDQHCDYPKLKLDTALDYRTPGQVRIDMAEQVRQFLKN
jgi:deoxyadenosine/deoxycytidine kinase